MTSIRWVVALVALVFLASVPAVAGNREMVEKRVRELHDLNRQVLEQFPLEKQAQGTIGVRVTGSPSEGAVRVVNDAFGDGRRATASTDAFSATEVVVRFRDAIARYVRKPVEIIPLQPPPDTREYAPFYLGILRLARGSR